MALEWFVVETWVLSNNEHPFLMNESFPQKELFSYVNWQLRETLDHFRKIDNPHGYPLGVYVKMTYKAIPPKESKGWARLKIEKYEKLLRGME